MDSMNQVYEKNGLPKKIHRYITQHFAAFWINGFKENLNQSEIIGYQVRIERWKVRADLDFDKEGNFLHYQLIHF